MYDITLKKGYSMTRNAKDGNYLASDFESRARDSLHAYEGHGYEFGQLDLTNPRSLVSIITSDVLRDLILNLPKEYFTLDEKELQRKAKVDELDTCLRLRFWDEYAQAQKDSRNMKMTRIFAGLCTDAYFMHRMRSQPMVLAWVCRPPLDYISAMRAKLAIGLDRFSEILSLPIHDRVPQFDSKGKPKIGPDGRQITKKQVNAKVLSEIRQITLWLHSVVHGAVEQRVAIEQKSLNVNMNAPAPQTYSMDELKKLEASIERIEEKLEGETLDVEVTEEVADSSADKKPEESN